MPPKLKAETLFDTFHQYRWDEKHGYVPDDVETKKVVGKVIDEIEKQADNWGVNSVRGYWVEVRYALKAL
jgi:hypothetical protein